MQRRARIKAVANLSSVRRGVVGKNGAENQQENESSKKDEKDQLNDEKSACTDEIINKETPESEPVKEISLNEPVFNDDVNNKSDLLEKIIEGEKSDEIIQSASPDHVDNSLDGQVIKENCKAESSKPTIKFRKPKITPRLNVARVAPKNQESDEKATNNDAINDVESPQPAVIPTIHNEKPPESPINLFSPPRTPRAETSRDTSDSPAFIINHNVHHPPTPQSPFYPIPHPRIRTESLCSIKSTTVANLQPRKKVRTEDQKILDNKRESRERLSNKKIEKSELRMFDMIYYNPTTNPMKPRAPAAKEKSPKKVDLTRELSPQPKEPAPVVPQLRLNANGELVLDEASLVVENEEQKKNRILLANTNVVYHDELSGKYGYYKRQQRTKEWPQEETIKFYRCLNTVGTDFSLMLNLFPNRSRRDLKLKFKKEEKNNPNLVDKALLNHNIFDIEELQRELDEEDEARRKEAESRTSEVKELVKRKILKKQEAKAKAKQQDKAKIEKILSEGDFVLNAVDNPTLDVKENMEKSAATKRNKRAVKRKIKPEPIMEFKKIMLNSQINPSISVNELKSPENQLIIPKMQPEHKSAVVVREISSLVVRHESSLLTEIESVDSLTSLKDESSKMSIDTKRENEKTAIDKFLTNLPDETQLDMIENEDTMLSKTGKFITDLITDSYRDTQENDYLIDDEAAFECNLSNVKKEEPKQRKTVTESTIQSFETEIESTESSITMQPSCSSAAITFEDNTDYKSETADQSAPVDDETFLNSLDLERLVIVVKNIDGKDIYDIHETEADSQQLSDKPLNLPRHIVDLIVSVMTQDD